MDGNVRSSISDTGFKSTQRLIARANGEGACGAIQLLAVS